MNYKISRKNIFVSDANTFDIQSILHSGQMFRFEQKNDTWFIQSGRQVAKIERIDAKNYKIITENPKYFVNYFDFENDYDIILLELMKFEFLKSALEFSKGVRILKQEPLETLICFIISANNNITRIKRSVKYICENFGSKLENGLFAFPTLEQLSLITVADFEKAGTGYRASYLVKTIQTLRDGFDLEELKNAPTEHARNELIKLAGVGPKVADCVLLFGLGHKEVFPVDTWIAKVYNDCFGKESNRLKMRKHLIQTFGKLSGIVQQYLFYYKRENKNIKIGEEKL